MDDTVRQRKGGWRGGIETYVIRMKKIKEGSSGQRECQREIELDKIMATR